MTLNYAEALASTAYFILRYFSIVWGNNIHPSKSSSVRARPPMVFFASSISGGRSSAGLPVIGSCPRLLFPDFDSSKNNSQLKWQVTG
ncbi:MAG TPA: hypothetical protein PLZ82_08805, partial [Smithellaceae bacterium]|nr:hypothetical protein [Smithellaceae bacterium]HOD64936.1 hypothetical protein [Smithellaceae bacterium]HOE23870.1 hypothetical protein [Smithellaceae bacterium]HPI52871.1 hypothetical protein [Smithellaceae bacterium]HPV73237.1 hypothetical protein [Smithellaceae bacterium]